MQGRDSSPRNLLIQVPANGALILLAAGWVGYIAHGQMVKWQCSHENESRSTNGQRQGYRHRQQGRQVRAWQVTGPVAGHESKPHYTCRAVRAACIGCMVKCQCI